MIYISQRDKQVKLLLIAGIAVGIGIGLGDLPLVLRIAVVLLVYGSGLLLLKIFDKTERALIVSAALGWIQRRFENDNKSEGR